MNPTTVYIDGGTIELVKKYQEEQPVHVGQSAIIQAAVREFCERNKVKKND